MTTPFVTDFTQSPQQILVSLIGADNGLPLTTAMVSFGPPSATTGYLPARNTTVKVSSVASQGYMGSQFITYNRVDLSTVPGVRNTVFLQGSAVMISDLLPAINSAYQINLSAADIVDGPLPVITGNAPLQQQPFTVTARSTALIWIKAVTLSMLENLVPLSNIFPTTALSGLTFVPPGS